MELENTISLENLTDEIDRHKNIRIKRNPKYLCFRCNHAMVMSLEGRQQPMIRCHNIGAYVPDTVTECSSFQALGSVGIWELAKLAKVIDNDPDQRKAGFLG